MDDGSVQPMNQYLTGSAPALIYRDSIIFSLGITNQKYTKVQLYNIYISIFEKLEKANFVNFYLPSKNLFFNMISKLTKEGIVEEAYDNQKYVLQLTNLGMGVYEVILEGLKEIDYSRKLYSIYRLYREAPVF